MAVTKAEAGRRREGVSTRSLQSIHIRQSLADTAGPELVSLDRETPHPKLPPQYELAPTVPSPFVGDLVTSLDAILIFGSQYPELTTLTRPLLTDVNLQTNWTSLFHSVLEAYDNPLHGRHLLEEFLFLITRTLLPEQITENRSIMLDLYSYKRNISTRVVLRYDMLREWKKHNTREAMIAESKPPPMSPYTAPPSPRSNPKCPNRRAFMENVIPTLIAAPEEGYRTKRLSDAMRHHVTELDDFLLLSDDEVGAWSTMVLLVKAVAAVEHWQWLRKNNAMLEDMKVNAYAEMDRKAEECEWVRDWKMPKEKDDS